VSVTVKASFRPSPGKGRRHEPQLDPALPEPVPRISRLMAIAIVIDEMVRAGETTYAEVARAAGVSRTRVSQVMRLLDLECALQLTVLFQLDPSTLSSSVRLLLRTTVDNCDTVRRSQPAK
jgi:hypothetical protein